MDDYGLSKWHIDRRDPERSIPSPAQRDANPVEFGYFLMDVSDVAEAAIKRGNHAEAIVYFKTLAQAVPEKAVSYRKVCISYQALHDWQNAAAYCKEALSKEGTMVEDFSRYAEILLTMKPAFTEQDGGELDTVVQHLRAELPKDTLPDEIACDVGLKLKDNARMQECTQRLIALAPDNGKTITYQWAYALQVGNVPEARRMIAKARQLSLSPQTITTLEKGLHNYSRSQYLDWLYNKNLRIGIFLAALAAVGIAALLKRRRLAVASS
jgi:tetratricopeptide (TPR) repeat protein